MKCALCGQELPVAGVLKAEPFDQVGHDGTDEDLENDCD